MVKLIETTKVTVTKVESVVVEIQRTVSTHQSPSTDAQTTDKVILLIDRLDREGIKQG